MAPGPSEAAWISLGLGGRVKRLREAAGMSQEALGEHVGCHRNTIWSIEAGRFPPTIGTLESMCRALDVTPNDLLGWREDPVALRIEVPTPSRKEGVGG